MDLFKGYTLEEDMNHKNELTRSQPKGYSKLPDNIWRQDNLILKSKQELKRGPSNTTQTSENTQGGKSFLKSVILHGAEVSRFGY